MYNEELEIRDRLDEILESIELKQEWSNHFLLCAF